MGAHLDVRTSRRSPGRQPRAVLADQAEEVLANFVSAVISTGGGDLKDSLNKLALVISTAGGNLINAKALIGQAGGNLIGQAGGN